MQVLDKLELEVTRWWLTLLAKHLGAYALLIAFLVMSLSAMANQSAQQNRK